MRLRICRQPTGSIDGVLLDQFRLGVVYDISTQLAAVFLAEGWAEAVADPAGARPVHSDNRIGAVVLIVDDQTDVRRVVAALLKCNGYDVLEASHGLEGLAQLRQHSPDLVVLDLDMPVMDGWQFRAEQQRLADGHLAAIPVLLFTAGDPAHGPVAALKAVGLIEKPFDPDRLLAAVEHALAR